VKSTHRQAITAASLLAALAGGSAIAGAQARPGQVPDENTPRILVPTFRSTDAKLGVQGAEAVRSRVSQEFTAKQLWAIPRNDINANLEASGYKPDSALSPTDIKELAKLLRADEIIDGDVTKLPDGSVKVSARMLLSRDVSLSQPLGEVTAKSVNDAAKPIAAELGAARKQLKDNRDCENAIRSNNYDAAIAAAQKGIAAYPKATLARLCMATALQSKKAPAADILKVTNEVLAVDPLNKIALGLLYAAQKESGDNAGAVATLLRLQKADPNNATMTQQVAEALAQLDPKQALPLLDTLVAQNPGDPSLVKTQWLVLLRAQDFARAVTVGEELAKLDTAAMDSTWFTRMAIAAGQANQAQKAAEYAARGVQRYPKSATFLGLQSQLLRKAGQLPQSVAAMQRAVAIDPKVENGYLSIIVGFSEMNQPDSAKAWAQKAIAAGTDKTQIGNALLANVQPAFKKAQELKTRAAWREALVLSQAVENVAPTENSAFFTGVAAFQVGLDAVQGLNKSKSCAEVNLVEEMFTLTQTTLPRGGKVDPGTAGQIMNVVGQVMPQIPQYKKALCGKGGKGK
jgi:tetratricopeptide (TPR) repeat protein